MGHALAAPNRRLPTLLLIALNSRRMASQVALAWLLTRPTVSSVIIGARNEAQLRDNLGAIGWSLTTEQIARLNAARDVMPAYPYYPYRTQEGFARLNPPRYEVCWTTFSHAMSSTAVRQEASKAHVWSPSRA
jgi:hypothetical protein